MRFRTRLTAMVAAIGLLAGAAVVVAPTAGAEDNGLGTTSLAEVLLADARGFDRNHYDFDIVTEAVLAVLEAKPDSPVGLLADGTVPLTAFIPNDRAFQVLVADLTGKWFGFFRFDEQKVFEAVASLGIDTVETVLLYHVVPGVTIDSATALGANGAQLTTAQGGDVGVKVISKRFRIIVLTDNDPRAFDPFIVPSKFDINAGNNQIAHGIALVLRPAPL